MKQPYNICSAIACSCLLVVVLLAGCRKYLEHPPDSSSTDLGTPEKVALLLGSAYPQANYMAFCEAMSDNVGDKGKGVEEPTNRDPYYFRDGEETKQDSPEAYWQACYTAIAAANSALEACNKAKDTSAYRTQRGEALVARAYSHFMLVNFFSRCYDPATAATDPGIPYVTTPETVVIKQYERKTVAFVYDMIERDLLEGLPLLSDDAYKVPRYHFNRAAANAFATRFYLFKKAYEKVLKYADAVFPEGDLDVNMRPWNTTYNTMTPNQLWATYARASEGANLLLCETSSMYGRWVSRYRYALDDEHNIEILGANVTGGNWAYPVFYSGTRDFVVPKITEYFVQLTPNATIGYPYVMVPLFTTEEVLFNRAEANAWLGNFAACVEDLNLFASKRILNYAPIRHYFSLMDLRRYYNISNEREALVKTILDFKRAEFVQEGMRWFDLQRYKMPVVHTTSDGQVLELTSEDKRRLLQIPAAAVSSGITLNPR